MSFFLTGPTMIAAVSSLVLSILAISLAAPTGHPSLSNAFDQSISLTKATLQNVRTFITNYKEVDLGSPSFEDYSLMLRSLPNCQMSYSQWVEMQDEERLQQSWRDLQVFWIHVDMKRIHAIGQGEGSALADSMEAISLDLRDLISQLNREISALNSTPPEPLDLTLPNNVLNPGHDWHSKLQGYIIFRDLETYLNKVIRDFTLLKTKY
ncbi:cardiotrophin-2 [Hemiscyllium ocellatum]|uniref:cardiotrophin-2 n=1 Tax=Hemiscyllium ocellatum TaxID=170820 RepID=UPI002966E0D8|nr:cardiotrophin-2 [Hemiscyllium ocellatum]